jgi:hypothetical protein
MDRINTKCSTRPENLYHGRHQGLSSRITLQYASQFTWRIFREQNIPADSQIFVDKFLENMRELRPTPAAPHIKSCIFILKNLYTCSHVFLRTDAVKSPLQPPYTGPYEFVKKLKYFLLVFKVERKEFTIQTEWLKPAYIGREDSSQE